MPQDAYHIRRLARELNTFLVGGKINRISQVDKDELTFIIYTGKSTVKLILSANASNARVCLSAVEKPPALKAPNFCMLLRKHLQGAEILSVRQHEFERIIEITLHCSSDFSECERVLRCELMGKYSNIVLTEGASILGALKTTTLESDLRRVLFAGAKYEYPAPQEKASPLDENAVRERLAPFFALREGCDKQTLGQFLFENLAGFAPSTAREAVGIFLEKQGIFTDEFTLKTEFISTLPPFLRDFCLQYPSSPCILFDSNGKAVDYFDFYVKGGRMMPSLCKAEDEFYTARETKKGFEGKKRKLESAAKAQKKKLEKHIRETREKLREADGAEENRVKGELLTANLYRVEKGMKRVEVENWYTGGDETLKIELDDTLSPAQNAQKYFKAYNKQKRAKEILEPRLKTELGEAEYLDSVLSSIALSETEEDLKEIEAELALAGLLKLPPQKKDGRKKEEIPFRAFEFGGFRIFAGRNNLQNDRLLRLAEPNDLWLHTQKYHSSHVIVATDGRKVPDEVVKFAAEVCAYYSDGRGGDKIPVDYCLKKFVKKPSKAKAGFVTYTDYKTALATPTAHEDKRKKE
ncbi:MAG: NFACT family protein [Clostridia bacterium]|nr:NFACT family protein [Clostridia bacterium]